jgi:hypothetical protein
MVPSPKKGYGASRKDKGNMLKIVGVLLKVLRLSSRKKARRKQSLLLLLLIR